MARGSEASSSMESDLAAFHTGKVIAEKFRIERVLGVGGMGVVLAARHLQLDRLVAIKLLRASAATESRLVQRFAREGRAAARIESAHVAKILDVDELEDGSPYLVMEHLEGIDLSQELKQRGRLPIAETISIVLQTCDAVAAAHAAGVIHRDLKPGNLFLARLAEGERIVKVLDFGISKVTDTRVDTESEAELDVTMDFEALGSPVYMSPEQMRSSRDVDTRTDIWSLGVILYKALVGAPPFPGKTVTDLCARIFVDPTPSVRTARPDVPEGLDAAIARCLAKDRDERFQSIAELARALAPYADEADAAIAARISTMPPPAFIAPSESSPRAILLELGAARSDGETIIASTASRDALPGTTGVPGSLRRWRGAIVALAIVGVVVTALVIATSNPAAEHASPAQGAAPTRVEGDESVSTLRVAPVAAPERAPLSAAPTTSRADAPPRQTRPPGISTARAGATPARSTPAVQPPPPAPGAASPIKPSGDDHLLHL